MPREGLGVRTHLTDKHYLLQFARTEWIQNTLSPRFSRAIQMDYRFEEVQQLQLSVYDIDNDTPSMNDDDFLGCIKCTLGEVGGAKRVWLQYKLCTQASHPDFILQMRKISMI